MANVATKALRNFFIFVVLTIIAAAVLKNSSIGKNLPMPGQDLNQAPKSADTDSPN